MASTYDIFVVGGGVNGCGIARDAAGRGYSVFLAEMNDLASGTSSWSTKLVHGGLRYLEHYEFRLVREALMEREVLWANAPHIIRPLRFLLPHHKGLRPAWLLRLGLFLYDHLGGRKLLPATRTVDLKTDPAGAPLIDAFSTAFEYSDCFVDDARLVVLNARDAADRGAVIHTRTKCIAATRVGDLWHVTIEDGLSGERETVLARSLVNASGPWVDQVLRAPLGEVEAHNVRLVQGSHIVVPKLFDHDRCYIFQNADGRIIFAIPYEGDFTLIGTTDREYEGDPADAAIAHDEIAYLCTAASEYFKAPVRESDVVWRFSGVRPLYDDGASKAQEATRDYVLKLERGDGAPLINIFGGKITTYRRLAEAVVGKLASVIGARKQAWTRTAPLPGGDFPTLGFDDLCTELRARWPFLGVQTAERLARLYGTRVSIMLNDVPDAAGLGEIFGGDLSACEVAYLMDHEWARTAEDVLWRRTKLGLRLSESEAAALETWMAARNASGATGARGDDGDIKTANAV
ncbi:glycerol-3-phosphate dehydrogenase [Breoghania sp. L-A4]|uniref:glycerol-3-phosphate dehydrogenase n=1 Tax=Breoghania sp. L-A4 TaxID=2304600 RepID=UPI0020C167D1|nr:glycerol-3-phosphate dehydrogenase [Breoghania sp. L-A4]